MKALQDQKSGELYQIVDQASSWSFREGASVRCYRALLYSRNKKKIYLSVDIFYSVTKWKLKELPSYTMEDILVERAKHLVCQKYHKEKCSPDPVACQVIPEVVLERYHDDDGAAFSKLVEIGERCYEYLRSPSKYDRTKLSVLIFDLGNVLSVTRRMVKREGRKEDGVHQEISATGGAD